MGDSGKLEKMDVDYSSTVDEKLPACEKLAKDGKLTDAVEQLLSLEKQTRTASDYHSTARLLVAIVRMCFEYKKWDLLCENIVVLSKRRGQLKQAVTKMVQEACTYVEQTPNMETKLKLIDTLRTVTAGKIYVELERARITKILAEIRESEENINEAATILQELQVETYGSMEKREKVEFILEQMRLTLLKKDYIRTSIISKKIATKFFDDKDVQDLKLKYYELMVELDLHEGNYLSICKHYRALYDTPVIKDDQAKRHAILKVVVLYCVLAPHDNEQHDLMHRILEDKLLLELPKYRELLQLFTTAELMRWSDVCKEFEAELRTGGQGLAAPDVFAAKPDGSRRWKDFKVRIVEHNIRVMSQYYTRVRLTRMAELLDQSEAETEEFLSALIVSGTVSAKVERVQGIVNFAAKKQVDEVLNDWSHSISELMSLVAKTTHLINKEQMVHNL